MTKIGRPGPQANPFLASTGAANRTNSNRSGVPDSRDATRLSQAVAGTLSEPLTAAKSPELLSGIRELQGVGEALHQAAFRLFLRYRLSTSLGQGLNTDAMLDPLTTDVLELMESDSALRRDMLDAGKALVELSRTSR